MKGGSLVLVKLLPGGESDGARDRLRLAGAVALFFLVLCAVGILRPVRNSLALDGLGGTDFYKTYLVSAVVVLFVLPYSRLADRIPWRVLIPGVSLFFATNLVGFRLLYREGSAGFGLAFYGWYDLFALTGLALVGGLWVAAGARLGERGIRYSAERAGREILYVPVPPEIKLRAKACIDMAVEKGLGKGLSGVLLLGLATVGGTRHAAWVGVALVVAWLVAAAAIRRERCGERPWPCWWGTGTSFPEYARWFASTWSASAPGRPGGIGRSGRRWRWRAASSRTGSRRRESWRGWSRTRSDP